MSDTERISMIWPADLKAAVVERTGGVRGGITEFTLDAVAQHLKNADDVKAADLELNETKLLAQLLADRIVMGGTQSDRLEALMEVEFPSWMDTSGWPSEFARRVPAHEAPVLLEETVPSPTETTVEPPVVEPEVATPVETAEPDMEGIDRTRVEEGKRKAAEARERIAVRTQPPAPETAPVPSGLGVVDTKDDLFARIAAQTGEDMNEVLGKVKTASEIEAPAPKPVEELSPKEQRYARQEAPEPVDDPSPAPESVAYPTPVSESVAYATGQVTVIEEMNLRPAPQPIITYAEDNPAPPSAVVVDQPAVCPNCHEELIDGECWTCG